jgi:uracil-DNA glycosylase
LTELVTRVRACRLCIEAPLRAPLPHEPRPVLRVSATARILIAGQAPGTRVHACGVPFQDPSGARLRDWLGVTVDEFYDGARVAFLPMGLCFPGLDAKGGDLPPRKECAPAWRSELMAAMPGIKLIVLVGNHAIGWHIPDRRGQPLSASVAAWREIFAATRVPRLFPLPHPSWRNSGWLKRNPWLEADALPELRREVRRLLDG